MLKKIKLACWILMVGMVFSSQAGLFGKQINMLVVPARYSVMQVAFDIARQFPTVLVAYQGDAHSDKPILHAWNGQEWVPIALADYISGSFLETYPDRLVLVGDAKLLPQAIKDPRWAKKSFEIADVQTGALINGLGNVLDFKPAVWQWFAGRYNLKLEDGNSELRKASWYDQKYEGPQGLPK